MATHGDRSEAAGEAIAAPLKKRPISTVVIIIGKAIKIAIPFSPSPAWGICALLHCSLALNFSVMMASAMFSYAD